MDSVTLLNIASTTAPFIAAVIALITYLFFRNQRQTNGLLEAFKILNNEEHRAARRKIFQIYDVYRQTGDLRMFFVSEVEMVRADFDIMGTLLKANSVDRKQFLRQFGPSAYLCWRCLKDHIDNERELRNFDPFMSDFQWLIEKAVIYWQQQGTDLSKTRIHMSKPVRFYEYDVW